ncbi:MAG: PTS sugar transporter subunit IIA [Planctomycetes bacterium]|nr:PTS sugar transporter subunit IIA [Planctomycetota bacterium]
MDIDRMMAPERVIMHLEGSTKEAVLVELAEAGSSSGHVRDTDALKRAIIEREKIMSTGIGLSIAIPHAKISEVSDFVLTIGRKPSGIDYDSLDGVPVKIIIMIAAPEGEQNRYLRILAKVTHVLRDDTARTKILAAETPEEIIALFRD